MILRPQHAAAVFFRRRLYEHLFNNIIQRNGGEGAGEGWYIHIYIVFIRRRRRLEHNNM